MADKNRNNTSKSQPAQSQPAQDSFAKNMGKAAKDILWEAPKAVVLAAASGVKWATETTHDVLKHDAIFPSLQVFDNPEMSAGRKLVQFPADVITNMMKALQKTDEVVTDAAKAAGHAVITSPLLANKVVFPSLKALDNPELGTGGKIKAFGHAIHENMTEAARVIASNPLIANPIVSQSAMAINDPDKNFRQEALKGVGKAAANLAVGGIAAAGAVGLTSAAAGTVASGANIAALTPVGALGVQALDGIANLLQAQEKQATASLA